MDVFDPLLFSIMYINPTIILFFTFLAFYFYLFSLPVPPQPCPELIIAMATHFLWDLVLQSPATIEPSQCRSENIWLEILGGESTGLSELYSKYPNESLIYIPSVIHSSFVIRRKDRSTNFSSTQLNFDDKEKDFRLLNNSVSK